jgi:hypothetical protein
MPDIEMWPALPYKEWASTKKTLHMCVQMLGKARLALAPPQPQWLHSCLYLSPRGLDTGPIPDGARTVSMEIDLLEPALWLRTSDGRTASVALADGRCVAEIWAEFKQAQDQVDLHLDMWEKPQELSDTTLFSENTHDCTIVPEQAQRFHRLLSSINSVFEEFRSEFFGRTGVQFWWGAFDLAVLLFSGKKASPPEDRGYIMRYDLDAEHMNAGFWPGDDSSPDAVFYGYLVPLPPGCATAPIEPEHAGWAEAMGEWMMPYEAVRTCPDPRAALLAFLRSVYRVALTEGGWDGPALEYTRPARPVRGRDPQP